MVRGRVSPRTVITCSLSYHIAGKATTIIIVLVFVLMGAGNRAPGCADLCFQRPEDFLRRDRQFIDAHTDRVEDRIGDRGSTRLAHISPGPLAP